jgi:hypothetical protein
LFVPVSLAHTVAHAAALRASAAQHAVAGVAQNACEGILLPTTEEAPAAIRCQRASLPPLLVVGRYGRLGGRRHRLS